MARIYLDARNITENPAGVARYALSLIPELMRQAPEHEYVVIRHTSNREPIQPPRTVPGVVLREAFVDCPIDNLQNFALGAPVLRQVFRTFGPPDLYHDLFHILPRGVRQVAGRAKIVVTLHDLVWLDHPHESQPTWLAAESIRAFARLAIPYALKTADHVISVSEPTARRARRWLEPARYTTISHGVSGAFFEPASPPPPELLGSMPPETPYIVAIGNAKPYKNLDRLIDAFARARADLGGAKLVLIGDCAALGGAIAWSGAGEDIIRTGILDDIDLRRVLGHARCFVFPSLVEGFGLPILEAMAMGIPTIVSDLEPMRSIADDAALPFDPYHTGELAQALVKLLRNDDAHQRYAHAARQRAAQFTWPQTARQTLAVYEKLLPAGSSRRR